MSSRVLSPSRARRAWRVRTILLVIAALSVLAIGPGIVGVLVTGDAQPRSTLTHPVDGWRLLVDVLVTAPAAAAPTPGSAMHQADRTWNSRTGYDARRAHLVYLAGSDPLHLELLDGTPVTASGSGRLAWIIEGTRSGSASEGVLGVLDYDTAQVRASVRTPRPTPENPSA